MPTHPFSPQTLPRLPRPLALPLGLLPGRAHSLILAGFLNRLLAPEIADGELDFLDDRVMRIRVSDAGVDYRLTLAQGRIQAATPEQREELSIEGTLYDFLLLATRREDPDTLFFNRRLRLGGDTELGLFTKNFLDALEIDRRLGALLGLLNGTTRLFERFA